VDISIDRSGNTWQGQKNALKVGLLKGSDHILIMQDDILPCADFLLAVNKIVQLFPDSPITYFSPREVVSKSLKLKKTFCQIKHFQYAQAYTMPRWMVLDYLKFQERHVRPDLMADDTRMAIYFFAKKINIIATAPSLVQHLCWDSSTTTKEKGNIPNFKMHMRTTSSFIGLEKSALDIDWTIPQKMLSDSEGDIDMFRRYIL
jgi:hypothetical protein